MTVIGTPIIQSTADRMTHLQNFAEIERSPDVKSSANPSCKFDFEFVCWAIGSLAQAHSKAVSWRTNLGTQIWAHKSGTKIHLERFCSSGWQ